MSQLVTDPRHLLQFMAAELALVIPVQMGSHIVGGQIVNYDDVNYATIQVTLYEIGPPLRSLVLNRAWPWEVIHLAVRDGTTLRWF